MGCCIVCSNNVKKRYDNPPRPESKYCSMKCKKEDNNTELTCRECTYKYIVRNSRAERSNYCSKVCFDKSQDIYGSDRFEKDGVMWVKARGKTKATRKGKFIQEHRLVASEFIGRDLIPNVEMVLHINGDNLDNHTKNIYVCASRSELQEIIHSSCAPYPYKSNLEQLKKETIDENN